MSGKILQVVDIIESLWRTSSGLVGNINLKQLFQFFYCDYLPIFMAQQPLPRFSKTNYQLAKKKAGPLILLLIH